MHTSVPTANLSNSNTPIGPFHMMVLVVSRAALNVLMESGPISNPIQPSGIADAGTICNEMGIELIMQKYWSRKFNNRPQMSVTKGR